MCKKKCDGVPKFGRFVEVRWSAKILQICRSAVCLNGDFERKCVRENKKEEKIKAQYNFGTMRIHLKFHFQYCFFKKSKISILIIQFYSNCGFIEYPQYNGF